MIETRPLTRVAMEPRIASHVIALLVCSRESFLDICWPDISIWMWAGIAVLTIVGSWLCVALQKIVSPELARLVVIVICFVGSIAAIVDGVLELQL